MALFYGKTECQQHMSMPQWLNQCYTYQIHNRLNPFWLAGKLLRKRWMRKTTLIGTFPNLTQALSHTATVSWCNCAGCARRLLVELAFMLRLWLSKNGIHKPRKWFGTAR